MPRPSARHLIAASRGLDRPAIPAGLLAAKGYVEMMALATRRSLVVAGTFDRSAIMAAAIKAARLHQARYGCTWAAALSITLTATWRAAKAARVRTTTIH